MSQRQFNQPTQGQYGGPGQQGQQGAGGGRPATGQPPAGGGPRGRLYPTQNHLGQDARAAMVETLNRVLADTTVLFTHAKFAHWNVKGMEFYSLHRLFDEIAETFEVHVDAVGERITALGGQAMGTAGMAVSNCSLPSMPPDASTGPEYVEILADRLAIHDANLYGAIQTAQEYGDPDTADLLNEVSREVTQQLYFLESHLQTRPIGGTGTDVQSGGQQTQLGPQPGSQESGGGPTPQQPNASQPPRSRFGSSGGVQSAGAHHQPGFQG